MNYAIEVEGLKKSYGKLTAVDDLSFNVEEGSLFAFLGLNGAGKSTTVNILCTLLQKDGGKVVVSGKDLDSDAEAIRNEIGVVFQQSVLDKRLTVKENLSVRASFYGMFGQTLKSRLKELAEILSLDDILNRPYGKLSGGQRRRADLARGLINTPKILFLDEPTTGLDPQTRKTVWETVDSLRKNLGMSVFLTTHYMEEADGADKVVIIDEGKLSAVGTPVDLKNRFSSEKVKLYLPRSEETDGKLSGEKFDYSNNCYTVYLKGGTAAKNFIKRHSELIGDFEVLKGDMDDVFLNVTGKRAEGGFGV